VNRVGPALVHLFIQYSVNIVLSVSCTFRHMDQSIVIVNDKCYNNTLLKLASVRMVGFDIIICYKNG